MKLAVIIGSTVETYTQGMKFFDKLEKKFKCKIKKKNYYTFETKIKENQIEFIFGYSPKRDKNYLNSVKKWKRRGRILPPPIEEVCKKIKGDKVLVLSFYGAFTGKLNEVYLPISTTKKFIKKRGNKLEDFKSMNNKALGFRNILIGKIKGKKSNHITTNMIFSPEKFNHGAGELVKVARFLSKRYHSIDMELYTIISVLKERFPIGAIGIASDILDKKDLHMEIGVVKNDWNLHTKKCLEAIEVMLR